MTPTELNPRLADLRVFLLRVAGRNVSRDLAEDLVQETLIRVVDTAGRIPAEALRPWSLGILRNVMRLEYRGRMRRSEVALVNDETNEAIDLPVEPGQETTADAKSALALIARLAPERRRLVEDVVILGLQLDEAACKYGLPLGTVKSQLNRTLAALREALDGKPLPATWMAKT